MLSHCVALAQFIGTIGAVSANVANKNKFKLIEVFVYDILYTFVLCTYRINVSES